MAQDNNSGTGAWFLSLEAECSDIDSENEGEGPLDEEDEGEDLVDNAVIPAGNHLELFQRQSEADDELQLEVLKRKYVESPGNRGCELSPRLKNIAISPRRDAKRRLKFREEDSGLENSVSNETPGPSTVQVQEGGGSQCSDRNLGLDILTLSNRKNVMCGRFKDTFSASFLELTRPFLSDKTVCFTWVCAVFGVLEALFESCKVQLETLCDYMHCCYKPTSTGPILLALLQFKVQKSRETVRNLLSTFLNIKAEQLLAEPPRTRSVPAALFWFKSAMSSCTYVCGDTPDWITKQTLVSHVSSTECKFDLSTMVQWAYDNSLMEESKIAYEYALLAATDVNAAAWLASPAQAKYVKDCATMVKYYKRAELNKMTLSEYLQGRLTESETGSWKDIALYLRFQGVDIPDFIASLKLFLRGIPKKNCIVFWGPPNTGKSYLCMSLLEFLGGKVISYVNSKSHFWLQPLADTRFGLLDDATPPCWDYFDMYMRNLCDGNPVSIDVKHRAPLQIKCPPLLVTSNYDVQTNDKWKYLHSRVKVFHLPNELPLDEDGQPVYQLNVQNWNSFFRRLWCQLGLQEPDSGQDDGGSSQGFRCCARNNDGAL